MEVIEHMDFSLKQALEVMIAMLVIALVIMVTAYLLKNNGSRITSTNSDIWKGVSDVRQQSMQLDAKPQSSKSYTGKPHNDGTSHDYSQFGVLREYEIRGYPQYDAEFDMSDDNPKLKMPNGGKVRVTFDACTTAPGSHIYLEVIYDSYDHYGNIHQYSNYSSESSKNTKYIQPTSSQWKTYTVELNLSNYGGEKERNIKIIRFSNKYLDYSGDSASWSFRNVRLEQM